MGAPAHADAVKTTMGRGSVRELRGKWRPAGALGLGLVMLAALAVATATGIAAAPASKAYTVGNYPVEAAAQDAVTAKERAMAEGQQAAFRSLLKRLIPVTQYKLIAGLKSKVKVAEYVSGVSVRSERNSSTRYIASLDFAFEPGAVRDFLRREGIPFVDVQSPQITIVPVAVGGSAEAGRQWGDAWKGLDQEHSLTPFKIAPLKAEVHADVVKGMAAGDGGHLRILQREYGNDLVLLAIADAAAAPGKLTVTIAGQDALGSFAWSRRYPMQGGDLAYTMELGAVVALGTLEGRWKALKVRRTPGGIGALSRTPAPVQLFVEYRSLSQWQQMRRTISETPGVEDFQVAGVTARGADIALRFPGGGEGLADSLEAEGLVMQQSGGSWVVRPR